jgi:flagellar protein FliS
LSGFGAQTYSRLGLETDVLNADPHRLVSILFDGALLAISRARTHLAQRRITEKCDALALACQIVDSGLRVSVDPAPDPEFAGRLVSLYQYITMRLLQANLRNDPKALDEAEGLLRGLRDAWAKIGPAAGAGGRVAAAVSDRAPAPVGGASVRAPVAAARALQAYRT